MTVNVKTVRVALNTATGTQDITIPGYDADGVAKGAIFLSGQSLVNDTLTANSGMNVGFSDLTDEVCTTIWCQDVNATARTYRKHEPLAIQSIGNGAVVDFAFTVVGTITDGIQINITDAPASAVLVDVVLIGGDDVANVKAVSTSLGVASEPVTVNVGFQPNVILSTSIYDGSVGTGQSQAIWSMGVAVDNGTTLEQRSASYKNLHNASPTDINEYTSSSKIGVELAAGAVVQDVFIDSLTATGFDFDSTSGIVNASRFMTLALELTGDTDLGIADLTHPSSTGNNKTTVPFKPNYGMLFSAGTVSNDSVGVGSCGLSISTFDGDRTASTTTRSVDNVATSDEKSQVTTDIMVQGAAETHRATVASLDNDGFTLNYTTATTSITGFALVLGGPPGINIPDVIWEPPTGWDFSVYSGGVIPEESILFYGEGSHDGADDVAVLTDTTQAWVVDEWVDFRVVNVTDGSTGVITANTATTITATLTGGTEDDWDISDTYNIVADVASPDEIVYETTSTLGGTVVVDVLGGPIITGVAGTHSFDYKVIDATDSLVSATATATVEGGTLSAGRGARRLTTSDFTQKIHRAGR